MSDDDSTRSLTPARAVIGERARTPAPRPAEKVPQRLGRYLIVGQLATGGMAQILLGKLIGPQGFERPVVIKRILPHFASDRDFVEMFLDEARLTVSIRHRNVVQVQELCQEDGELFLVMEYLNGETLIGVMRRLASDGTKFPLGLAAHVIAEACVGLHAAHESVDSKGNPAGLVHRDISPDNIFVTYEGEVKVLDFGIAKAAGRSTKTEVGSLKGKLAYMSPEQCHAQPLDRRSDVFSLGIVLYELATLRRLFKRPADMLTMQAVCNDVIPKPSSNVRDCPPLFDTICARALERNVDARYATMKAMRQDLVRLLGELPSEEPYDEQLKNLMRSLFSARVEEKATLLRNVSLGVAVENLPQGEVEGKTLQSVSHAEQLSGLSRVPARSSPGPMIALGTLAIVALGLGVYFGTHRPPPVTVSPIPAATMNVPAPPNISVSIDSTPSATVSVDGKDVGQTPYALSLPRGGPSVVVELHKDGYVAQRETIVPNADQRIRMALVAVPTPTTTAAKHGKIGKPMTKAATPPASKPEPKAAEKNPFGRWE